jgi:hypothetical protein
VRHFKHFDRWFWERKTAPTGFPFQFTMPPPITLTDAPEEPPTGPLLPL